MKTGSNLLNWKMKVAALICVVLLNARFANAQISQWDVVNGIATTRTIGEAIVGEYVQIGDIIQYVSPWKNASLWIKSTPMSGEAQNQNQVSLAIDNWQDYTVSNPNNIVEIKRRDVSGATPTDYPFLILGNGKVTIGVDPAATNLNGNFKLFVGTGILTERVKVEHSGIWPDFVFNDEYKLQSLKEVEEYIRHNKHLPNVPSAGNVAENGIDLGEMDGILLQKIEELTLYMIDLKKENDNLRARLEKLEK